MRGPVKIIANPKSSPVGRSAACCMLAMFITLTGCNQNGTSNNSASQAEDLPKEKLTDAEGQNISGIADDPFLPGNDVVLHEYGDDKASPVSSPNKVPANIGREPLRGIAIRRQVVGHELTDGAHWSWKFRPGGRLLIEENGREGVNRWRIEDDKLCIDASDGALCYTVSHHDGLLQLWRNGTIEIEAELN